MNSISNELLIIIENDESNHVQAAVHLDHNQNIVNVLVNSISSELPIELEIEECAHIQYPIHLSVNETCLINTYHDTEEQNLFSIAPSENSKPVGILSDKFCEELAHPHLFQTGKFGYTHKRDVKLTPVKYFNQRLLNYTQKFASDSDYIFFAHSVLQQQNLNSHINIAM